MDSSFGLESIFGKKAILIDDLDDSLSKTNKGVLKRLMSGNRVLVNSKFEKHRYTETKDCLILVTSNHNIHKMFRSDPALTEKRFPFVLELFNEVVYSEVEIDKNSEIVDAINLKAEISDFMAISVQVFHLGKSYGLRSFKENDELPDFFYFKLKHFFPQNLR